MSKKPQTAAMIIKVRTRLRRDLIDIRYHLSADDRDSQSFDNCACRNSRAADQQAAPTGSQRLRELGLPTALLVHADEVIE
jgi:hypothetical protein